RVELTLKLAEILLADCEVIHQIACTDPTVRMNERNLVLADRLDIEHRLLQLLKPRAQPGQMVRRQRGGHLLIDECHGLSSAQRACQGSSIRATRLTGIERMRWAVLQRECKPLDLRSAEVYSRFRSRSGREVRRLLRQM